MSPDEILDSASKIVSERWHQGGLMDWDRPIDRGTAVTEGGNLMRVIVYPVCAVGALREAAFGDPADVTYDDRPEYDEYITAVRALEKTINEHHEAPANVPVWNDQIAQSGDEVAQVMRETAAELRIKGETA